MFPDEFLQYLIHNRIRSCTAMEVVQDKHIDGGETPVYSLHVMKNYCNILRFDCFGFLLRFSDETSLSKFNVATPNVLNNITNDDQHVIN